MRNRSTEHFSGLPYIYALLNCLITMWYGMPAVSSNNVLVMTVNAMGAAFQLVYIILFTACADKAKKVRMLGLLAGDIILFAIIVAGSLQILNCHLRQIVVGVISGFALISMFASPLFIINLVIRTRSVEFMPFYLSLSTFLMSTSFLMYGILNGDIFVFLPNGIGTLLGMTQLLLYCYYKSSGSESSREPLIESYS
ncbi:hypothetical protein CRG98_011590 [Punica granatum]|nr:hypothetical protein CRG98_011590 [Punica granatum]